MNQQTNPINLHKLKEFINEGIRCIPTQQDQQQAVLVIGDTGVGKSTIMSFLSGSQLIVRFNDGLKPILDTKNSGKIKIGHEKYSQTSIPTKIVIDKMAFYDCPGFKDNKGEEYEISNSFFVQRLLDIYQKIKIVLIVDESHITEARADKLPKLIKNLHQAFQTFADIQDGVILIINRAEIQSSVEDYYSEILRTMELKNQDKCLFDEEEKSFLHYLIQKQKITLFKQASKQNKDKCYEAGESQSLIMECIKNCQYVKSKHITNIISESAKLAIRDYIDEITQKSNRKIEIICQYMIKNYKQRLQGNNERNIEEMISIKNSVLGLNGEIKTKYREDILSLLQRELPLEKLQYFEEDYAAVMFFKAIYDKTNTYFSNIVNKIDSMLLEFISTLDIDINKRQKQIQEEQKRERERMEREIKEQEREKARIAAIKHCSEMDRLKQVAKNLFSQKKNVVQELRIAVKCISDVEQELRRIKEQALNLQVLNRNIEDEFSRLESSYGQKKILN